METLRTKNLMYTACTQLQKKVEHGRSFQGSPTLRNQNDLPLEIDDISMGIILLQFLPSSFALKVPADAQAIPRDTSTTPENQSLLHSPSVKRAWPDRHHTFFVLSQVLGGTWHLRFNVLEWATPMASSNSIAARDLLDFYSATFKVASVVWAHEEPKIVRRAIYDGIYLIFWSQAPITWDFLDAFFKHIIDRTRGGLVSGYEVTCVAEVTGVVVNVMLALPNGDLRAAPAARRSKFSLR
ncbi:MAG: hypothetical protein Q9219_003879 [cf. Caloplaca sp. 3 TL-2023]